MDEDREVSSSDARALESVTRHLVTGRAFLGVPLRVTFVAANTKRDIAHGLGVIPDGYEIILADAEIHATPDVLWTPTIAYLQAAVANAHAIVRFYTLREVPIDA